MMANAVRIISPSRIHFGLLSVNTAEPRRFGGAGVMLNEPGFELTVRKAERTVVLGRHATRARQFVDVWQRATGINDPVAVEVSRAPPAHVGLGSGTQLGLSIAWALDFVFGREDLSLEQRVLSVDRGGRSAVGAYGFCQGGLIVEDGKASDDVLGRLHARLSLPETWRVLLARFRGVVGLAGATEELAFHRLPSVSESLRRRLHVELYDRLVPAAREHDFSSFAESVYQYGYAAGECFASYQGGPFLNSQIAEFVDYCRGKGVCGVGQSSWGPTVYCWFPSPQAAEQFVERELANHTNLFEDVVVSPVAQQGARCFVEPHR